MTNEVLEPQQTVIANPLRDQHVDFNLKEMNERLDREARELEEQIAEKQKQR